MYSLTFHVRVMLPQQCDPCSTLIANSPNSGQLGAFPTTPSLHPGPCNNVGMRPRQTYRQTHTQTCVTTIHFASSTTDAKCNQILSSDATATSNCTAESTSFQSTHYTRDTVWCRITLRQTPADAYDAHVVSASIAKTILLSSEVTFRPRTCCCKHNVSINYDYCRIAFHWTCVTCLPTKPQNDQHKVVSGFVNIMKSCSSTFQKLV